MVLLCSHGVMGTLQKVPPCSQAEHVPKLLPTTILLQAYLRWWESYHAVQFASKAKGFTSGL